MATQRWHEVPQVRAIEDAHEQLGLTYRDIADALQAQESTLHRWRRGEVIPTAVFLGRLDSLGDLLSELNRTFADAERAREWLAHPVPALQQRTPREVISAGQMDRITGLLYALNAGIPT
jgi:transcriptional regulator with XRE-family HTH domain